MGSIRIATIEALPESMRRSRGKRSAARRRNQIHLIAVLVWGKRWTVVAGRRMISALQHELRTKRCRFCPATTAADEAPSLSLLQIKSGRIGDAVRQDEVLRKFDRRLELTSADEMR